MTRKKRKTGNASLREEEALKIPLEISQEELIAQIKKVGERNNSSKPQGVETVKPSVEGKKMKQNIDQIKVKDGIIGYILRNSSSASIDLKDPARIIDYADLSSSTLETSEEISKAFKLGDVKYILAEGNTVKVLSFCEGESKVSVFMEKKVDHKKIHKELLS